MGYTLNRQPHFKEQPKDQLVVWVYGLFSEILENYIKKPMRECTGLEITEEWRFNNFDSYFLCMRKEFKRNISNFVEYIV